MVVQLLILCHLLHAVTLTSCATLSCDRFTFQHSLSALTPPSFPFKVYQSLPSLSYPCCLLLQGSLNLFIPDLSFSKERLPLLVRPTDTHSVAILQGGLGGQGPPNHSQCPSKIITNKSSRILISKFFAVRSARRLHLLL